MQFAFTADQQALADATHTLLIERCTAADLHRLADHAAPFDPERLAALRELGVFGVLAPEAHGGLSLRPADFASIAYSAGYVALPEPLIEQAGVVIPTLASVPTDRGWLARAVQDALIAIQPPGSDFVLHADSADAFLLAHGDDLHLVESGAVRLTRQPSIDPLRRLFSVDWSPAVATRIGSGWARTLDLGALWTAGQLLGLAQRAIDLSVAYAQQRKQFGKPIGSYQAVKHLLATAQVKIEFARPVFHAAAAEFGAGPAASARISHAKLAAIAAADNAMRAALQSHGAMGFTWEVGLHFYLKRALALRFSWGDESHHRRRVIHRITDLPTGPDFTFCSEVLSPACAAPAAL
jgi:alkylation response protein AidB-like acyl-CoA dehydrogenase